MRTVYLTQSDYTSTTHIKSICKAFQTYVLSSEIVGDKKSSLYVQFTFKKALILLEPNNVLDFGVILLALVCWDDEGVCCELNLKEVVGCLSGDGVNV